VAELTPCGGALSRDDVDGLLLLTDAPWVRRRVRTKSSYHHGNLRHDLVGAALQIIDRDGLAPLTLRAVAARLGVSAPATYRHFASKEALLAAVAAEGFASLLERTRAAMAAAGDAPIERFLSVAAAYVRFGLEHAAHFQVMYGPRPAEFEAGVVAAAGREAFKLFIGTIVACQRAGVAAPGDPVRVAVEAWSYAHGLVMLHLHRLLPRAVDDRVVQEMAPRIRIFLNPGASVPAAAVRRARTTARRHDR
jgi:AcrR family transcriptional regulator